MDGLLHSQGSPHFLACDYAGCGEVIYIAGNLLAWALCTCSSFDIFFGAVIFNWSSRHAKSALKKLNPSVQECGLPETMFSSDKDHAISGKVNIGSNQGC